MNNPAKDFLGAWVAKNIHDEPFVRADEPDPRPAAFAGRCKTDAETSGLTEEQLCKAAIDLHGARTLIAYMAQEIDIHAQKHLAEVAGRKT